MAIQSIGEYYDTISTLATSGVQQTNSAAAEIANASEETERDSYVSTITDSTEAIPSENYNDILQVMAKNNAAKASSATETESEETQEESVSGAGGSGGGSDSSDEDETTTEIVTINGVTYLETTTTANGITTTSRTVISGGESDDE